jgi:hypothetical protein
VAAITALAIVALATVAFAEQGPPGDNSCGGAFQGNPEGTLAKAATRDGAALQDGAEIAPGDKITFTFTWSPLDWMGLTLDKLVDCFELNGQAYPALDWQWKPINNTGSASHEITVPALNDGDQLCDRARLSGNPAPGNPSTQKSNGLCFTIGDDGGSTTGSTTGETTTGESTTGETTTGESTTGETTTGESTTGTTEVASTTGQTTGTQVKGRKLVKTGSETTILAAFGILFLVGGALLTVAARRESSIQETPNA